MKNNLYSVYDSVAESYIPVFHQSSDAVATRTFSTMCKDRNHEFGRNPQDYTLYYVGAFNSEFGVLIPSVCGNQGDDSARLVIKGSDAVNL